MSHPRRGTLQWLALLTCLLATAPSGAAAAQAPQACEMGTISEITFNRQKPFLPEATSEEATLGWSFRGMDAVHITTTEGTIRWEFLFEEGELARALEGFLYDMEPYDPEMLIGVAIVLILVSAVACLAPALGATTVDPVSVLKGD